MNRLVRCRVDRAICLLCSEVERGRMVQEPPVIGETRTLACLLSVSRWLHPLLLALLLASTRLQAAEPLAGLPWSYAGLPNKEMVARQAVEVLLQLCPRMLQAMPDFASFEAEYRSLQPSDRRYRAGYRVLVEGGPVLAERRARVMPSPPFIPGDHTLFEILGPPRPGIAMDKATALWLCNASSPQPGSTTFLLMPEFAFIGR